MQVAIVFLLLCVGVTVISGDIYGVEISTREDWWNDSFFLKFNSPSRKSFYINFRDGTISREKKSELFTIDLPIPATFQPEAMLSGTDVPLKEQQNASFISFVSIDLKIYDIYFEHVDVSYIPRLEQSKFNYERKYELIRHRLHSFVGPDKKVYNVVYGSEPTIAVTEKSSETFQIKTFGPYEKWEHTYDFSENGEYVTDHKLSSIPVSSNRSIAVPKMHTFIKNEFVQLLATFNAPSGTKYYITDQLNIILCEDSEIADTAYITFTEPDGRTYDIFVDKEDGHPFLVEKSLIANFYGRYQGLYSFVGPNQLLYRIDHNNESDHKVPILVSDSSKSSELQITFLQPEMFYNRYIKYVFSDNGTKIFDRVDEIDWTPLNEKPAIPIEEVNANYVKANKPFLTFFSPSGNNYHIFTNQTNATIAIEKGTKNSQPLYITYFQSDGRKTHIYFKPGDHPYMVEETNLTKTDEPISFRFASFVTPDQIKYSIKSTPVNDNEWKQFIQLPFQVEEPIDRSPEDSLSITVSNENGNNYVYRFTWNGDKLIQADILPPLSYVDSKVLASLVGK